MGRQERHQTSTTGKKLILVLILMVLLEMVKWGWWVREEVGVKRVGRASRRRIGRRRHGIRSRRNRTRSRKRWGGIQIARRRRKRRRRRIGRGIEELLNINLLNLVLKKIRVSR